MPLLPPRQEQASATGPSAGLTFGLTFAGILGLGLVVFLIFFVVRKTQRSKEGGRRGGLLFSAEPDETKDHLIDEQAPPVHSESDARIIHRTQSVSTPLTSPDSAGSSRPLVPRITIPDSPGLMTTAFMDAHGSAVHSACMDSSESASAYSAQFPSATSSHHPHPITVRAGPSRLLPVRTQAQQQQQPEQPTTVARGDVTAAVARPVITAGRAAALPLPLLRLADHRRARRRRVADADDDDHGAALAVHLRHRGAADGARARAGRPPGVGVGDVRALGGARRVSGDAPPPAASPVGRHSLSFSFSFSVDAGVVVGGVGGVDLLGDAALVGLPHASIRRTSARRSYPPRTSTTDSEKRHIKWAWRTAVVAELVFFVFFPRVPY
ncbi:hypothetical protein MVEN_02210900 [Mycena venus]|uniref:Uncharacterized protein n=1 Tax=Mycena venus TaxID=2733690 RepID=A0A8H6X6Q8_9AGAR|nr:hypothetical protein MVEN_02210900 [Mycena venus]